MSVTFPHTIYVRPNPRFPKIIALAVLLDHIRRNGGTAPKVVMMPADEQPKGEGIYNLDCGKNEYRERKLASELAVVRKDFGIGADEVQERLEHDLAAHNKGGGGDGGKSFFFMNHQWGSAGWFSGCAWPLIENVHAGHWRWATEAVEDAEGIVLAENGRPKFRRTADAQPLNEYDFLGMSMDVVTVFLEAQRAKQNKTARSWGEGQKLEGISRMLNAEFTGSDLAKRKVLAGNFMFPTMSGYIRDLWVTGSTLKDVRNRLRPWLRLWDIAGDCYIDANSLKPLEWMKLGGGSYGVVFDLGQEKSPAADGNPIIHQRWLAKRGGTKTQPEEEIDAVIVRRETGHTAIICRRRHETQVKPLFSALDYIEPGRWHNQGLGLYNGSYSRVEKEPSKIPLNGRGGNTLVVLVTHALERSYEFADGHFSPTFGGWTRGMFE